MADIQKTNNIYYTFPDDIKEDNYPYISFSVYEHSTSWVVKNNPNGSSPLEQTGDKKGKPLITINLPLSQTLQNNINPQWEMADTKLISAGAEVIDRFKNVNNNINDTGNNKSSMLWDVAALAPLETPKKLFGMIANPKKQAFFNGIEPRTFQFNYSFSPKDLSEANTIENIINAFTEYSLPSLDTQNSAFFKFPHEFLIKFYNVKGFPELDFCVCTGITTDYNSGQMQLLKSGHPVQMSLQLTFLETSLRTKENIGIQK
jgi:hypothetical protein